MWMLWILMMIYNVFYGRRKLIRLVMKAILWHNTTFLSNFILRNLWLFFFRSVKQKESDQPTSAPIVTWRHYYTGSAMTFLNLFSFAGKDDTSSAYHFKKLTELGTSFFVLTQVISWWVYMYVIRLYRLKLNQ